MKTLRLSPQVVLLNIRCKKIQWINLDKDAFDILGIYGTILGIYDFIASQFEPSNTEILAEIKEGFQKVDTQLNSIKQSINEVINIVLDQSIRTQYGEAERQITDCVFHLNSYLSVTSPNGQYLREQFVNSGDKVGDYVRFLLKGMLGEYILSSDLLDAVVRIEKVTG
jgi:hypothetical protein